MDHHIRLTDRSWDSERHLRHVDEGDWCQMLDADGKVLDGISGKPGVKGVKEDGTEMGCDFIKMNPGTAFPLHVHSGDHEIFFISGSGFVHIGEKDIAVRAGHVIHIYAEEPHGVWVAKDETEPLVFVAAGHPHKDVDSSDRMQHPPHR